MIHRIFHIIVVQKKSVLKCKFQHIYYSDLSRENIATGRVA
jgi:hypothetical protein